jgi:hypothetical protein
MIDPTRHVPTVLPALPPPESVERKAAVPGRRPDDPPRTGIVWVHGIGTQKARESLFDWTRPIIDVLGEWRREYDEDHPGATIGENPVGSASVSDAENAWIELDIPKYGAREREHWIFTEAYWAGDVRPPSFSAAASYLLRQLPMIIRGIARGYGRREPARMRRLEALRTEHAGDPRVRELKLAFSRRWQLTDRLDQLAQTAAVRWTLMIVATGVALLALAIYSALHAIPIPPLRKRLEIAAADTFIVEWFGDLPVLLDDQAQAAAVRTRLLERVAWLKDQGCSEVVLLAHSGGTIVSYATLLSYSAADLPVDKLITFGEAIQLGWRLEEALKDWVPGNSVRGDLKARHHDLRWVDIWASYDPAPSGPLVRKPGAPLRRVQRLSQTIGDGRIEVESRPVTNFMHLGLDHGGYWANDEGFLIPVIRHIDDPSGDGQRSRFFADPLDRTLRTERRRRRVALLFAWRWAAFGAAVLAVAGLVFGATDAEVTGDSVASAWSVVPGHELLSGVIDGFGRLVALVLTAIGAGAVATTIAPSGPSVLGGLVPVAATWLIYSRGVKSWFAHDALERRIIRRERMRPAGLASARSEAALVIGGLLTIAVASWTGSVPLVLLTIAATALLGAIVRFRGREQPAQAELAVTTELTGGRADQLRERT